jgi:hypothetical protein
LPEITVFQAILISRLYGNGITNGLNGKEKTQ